MIRLCCRLYEGSPNPKEQAILRWYSALELTGQGRKKGVQDAIIDALFAHIQEVGQAGPPPEPASSSDSSAATPPPADQADSSSQPEYPKPAPGQFGGMTF